MIIITSKSELFEMINCFFIGLQHASQELKSDKETVIYAVKNYGQSLQYASNNLKNDKEVVLEACINDECSLQFASDEIQDLVRDNDAVKTLKSFILHEKLQASLSTKTTTKRVKI